MSGAWLNAFLFHLWDCAWTTTRFVSQLAFAYDNPFAAPTPVTTVVCKLMALPCTDSAANGVRDIINVMLLSTTSSIVQCLQPICHPGGNQLVSPAPMANAPMESRWFPGTVIGS